MPHLLPQPLPAMLQLDTFFQEQLIHQNTPPWFSLETPQALPLPLSIILSRAMEAFPIPQQVSHPPAHTHSKIYHPPPPPPPIMLSLNTPFQNQVLQTLDLIPHQNTPPQFRIETLHTLPSLLSLIPQLHTFLSQEFIPTSSNTDETLDTITPPQHTLINCQKTHAPKIPASKTVTPNFQFPYVLHLILVMDKLYRIGSDQAQQYHQKQEQEPSRIDHPSLRNPISISGRVFPDSEKSAVGLQERKSSTKSRYEPSTQVDASPQTRSYQRDETGLYTLNNEETSKEGKRKLRELVPRSMRQADIAAKRAEGFISRRYRSSTHEDGF
ncbi:hypothetical protein sscle_01g002400 [Sclerotinia sclerotiorum 1980 UF-70]|uniref:Uncharacterized protein n=1 Tax=Sclerotinia sclerotiorum (strain ATCC 18683 / 1980 / Ss-1) TaxID=665079 RepID=A0A1D9PS33_SCLS1|nr:hypothetical protein sscle_01g002400 [Sclerotinia sclerotiorum 1980 UF-70]